MNIDKSELHRELERVRARLKEDISQKEKQILIDKKEQLIKLLKS